MSSALKDMIEKTEKIEPITVVNGIKVVQFSEQRDLAQVEKMIPESGGLDTIQMNPDGTVARTPVRYAAVNLDYYYINRYKKVKDSLYIVNDFRAIQEQQTGAVYAKQIQAYVVSRDKVSGNLQLDKTVMISDTEFVSDFTHTLNREAMAQIVPLLANGIGVTTDDLGI